MTEFRYDTQLLIEGENLDEDTVHDISPGTLKATACWPWGMKISSKYIFTQTNPGRYWNIVRDWGKFSISWWRIWTGRRAA